MKYYFLNKDSEISYNEPYFTEYMKEHGLKEIEVIEAKIEKIEGWLWCIKYQDPVELGLCGKWCKEYEPRNGKSGICKHHGFFREPTDKKIKLKL